MKNKACHQVSIANSKLGEVIICPECGVVHLSLQSISIRLDVDAFADLAQMVTQAQTIIEHAKQVSQDQRIHETPHNIH